MYVFIMIVVCCRSLFVCSMLLYVLFLYILSMSALFVVYVCQYCCIVVMIDCLVVLWSSGLQDLCPIEDP